MDLLAIFCMSIGIATINLGMFAEPPLLLKLESMLTPLILRCITQKFTVRKHTTVTISK